MILAAPARTPAAAWATPLEDAIDLIAARMRLMNRMRQGAAGGGGQRRAADASGRTTVSIGSMDDLRNFLGGRF